MDVEKMQSILLRIKDIDAKVSNLFNLDMEITSQLDELNNRIDSLFRAYKFLDISSDKMAFEEKPITKEIFLNEISDLKKKLTNSLQEEKNESERITINEKYIADMFDLTAIRWNTVCELKKICAERRKESRNLTLALQGKYTEMANDLKVNEWNAKAEVLFTEHIKLVEEEEKYLLGEDELQKELLAILDLRKKLFDQAEEWFLS